MGCCGSAPTADEYLALAQPECPDPLMPSLPRAILSNQCFRPSALGVSGGGGAPFTLSLTSPEGALLANINMPPRGSFGVGATVTDPESKVVAWLRTAETSRPHGTQRSSYNIFAPRPQVQGQRPTVVDKEGTSGYLWATVTRAPFTSSHTVANASGIHIFTGRFRGMSQTYLLDAAGAGACYMSKAKTKPPVDDIRLAQGVDALLCVLIRVSFELADDEVQTSSN